LEFEWDENKNIANLEKHGLSLETATLVFQDPDVVSILDDRYEDEGERWISIGRVEFTIIYVAHTVKEEENGEEIIRIISARKATPREEREYYSH
jgi:uncharacterized DUF497 family protein